jgi:hypothetical protein
VSLFPWFFNFNKGEMEMLTKEQIKEAVEFNEYAVNPDHTADQVDTIAILVIAGFQQSQGLIPRDGKLNKETLGRIDELLKQLGGK